MFRVIYLLSYLSLPPRCFAISEYLNHILVLLALAHMAMDDFALPSPLPLLLSLPYTSQPAEESSFRPAAAPRRAPTPLRCMPSRTTSSFPPRRFGVSSPATRHYSIFLMSGRKAPPPSPSSRGELEPDCSLMKHRLTLLYSPPPLTHVLPLYNTTAVWTSPRRSGLTSPGHFSTPPPPCSFG